MSTTEGTSKQVVKIFAHDAGGANATAAYAYFLRRDLGYRVEAFGRGPAIEIYREHLPESLLPEDRIAFLPSDLIVTGLSGIHSKFELEMIRKARASSVRKIISIMDRSNNLDLRFKLHGKIVDSSFLPDEIWTPEITEISESPEIQRLLIKRENPYWRFIKEKRYAAAPAIEDEFVRAHRDSYFLYVTDYLLEQEGFARGYTEFTLLESFLIACRKRAPESPILLRLHPAEKDGKYADLLGRFSDLRLYTSPRCSLAEYLYYARAVFGNFSSVFYESVMIGKPTFSLQLGAHQDLRRYPEGVSPLLTSQELEENLAQLAITKPSIRRPR